MYNKIHNNILKIDLYYAFILNTYNFFKFNFIQFVIFKSIKVIYFRRMSNYTRNMYIPS